MTTSARAGAKGREIHCPGCARAARHYAHGRCHACYERERSYRRKAYCRHCQARLANRPRQLCWSCFYRPGVRDRYPPTSKFANRGVGLAAGPRPLPPEPTAALPGSPEKCAVLLERAERGFALFHPGDATRQAEG